MGKVRTKSYTHERFIAEGVQLGGFVQWREVGTSLLAGFLQFDAQVAQGVVAAAGLAAHVVVDTEVLARPERDDPDWMVLLDRRRRIGRCRSTVACQSGVGTRPSEGCLSQLGDELGQLRVGPRGKVDLHGE